MRIERIEHDSSFIDKLPDLDTDASLSEQVSLGVVS